MRRALALLALSGVTLAACAGGQTRFYTLDAAGPAAPVAYAAAYAGPPVRVDAVHIPAALDRLELVDPDGANGVKVRDLAHWAAPLGELSRRALTQDLVSRLPQGAVIFPDSPKPPGAHGLVVDILAFDGSNLDASWSVLPATRGGPLRQRQARLTTSPPAGPDGQAAALSALLGQLADRIAADLAAAPPA